MDQTAPGKLSQLPTPPNLGNQMLIDDKEARPKENPGESKTAAPSASTQSQLVAFKYPLRFPPFRFVKRWVFRFKLCLSVLSKLLNENNLKASSYGLNDCRIIILRQASDQTSIIFKILFTNETNAKSLRDKLLNQKVELISEFKERIIHALVGPFKAAQDALSFETFVHDVAKLNNVVVKPNVDKWGIFQYNAYCKINYADFVKFNSMNLKQLRGDERFALNIRYYKRPENYMCRKCGKRYHGNTKCCADGCEICFHCGKIHNRKEHKPTDPYLPYCVYCNSKDHKSQYCPHTRRHPVPYEEFIAKPPKQAKLNPPSDEAKAVTRQVTPPIISSKTYSSAVAPTTIHSVMNQSNELKELKNQFDEMKAIQTSLLQKLEAFAEAIIAVKQMQEDVNKMKDDMKDMLNRGVEKSNDEEDEEMEAEASNWVEKQGTEKSKPNHEAKASTKEDDKSNTESKGTKRLRVDDSLSASTVASTTSTATPVISTPATITKKKKSPKSKANQTNATN
jgi:hypothetical protein